MNATDNNNSLVSVIIPVYNVETFLHACLESIIAQSYKNMELILVDDGSTDSSGKICDKYALKDTRINVIHKKNEGVTIARITGYNYSKGNLITFVDSDDYLAPNAVETFVKAYQKSNADVVVCNICEIKDEKLSCRRQLENHYFDRQEIKEHLKSTFLYDSRIEKAEIPLYLWGKLFRKSVLENALEQGYNIWYEEDFVSMVYIIYHVQSMYIIPDKLYYYVIHDGQVSKKNPLEIFQQMKIARERISSFDFRHVLDFQLNCRFYGQTKDILAKLSYGEFSYSAFKDFFVQNRKSVEMQNFLNSGYSPILFTDKVKYCLLKYRLCRTYYLFLSIWKYVKNF